jgi:hypothetical protein
MPRRNALKRVSRKRYKIDRGLPPLLPNVSVVTAAVGSPNTKAVVTFSGPVLVNPAASLSAFTFNGNHPTGISAFGTTSATFTLAGALVAAQAYSITSFQDAIRTRSGGYVLPTAGSLS